MLFTPLIIIFLGYVFFTSSLSKIRNVEGHISSIAGYNVFPNKLNRIIGYLDILIELLSSISLLLTVFIRLPLIIIIFLLLVYSIIITINLIKGVRNIDCGCGGLVGNHRISYKLVIRNIVLIIIGLFGIYGSFNDVIKNFYILYEPIEFIFSHIVIGALLTVYYLLTRITKLNTNINGI